MKKYADKFNEKWWEDDKFGFGKVANFTAENICLLAFFACQIWGLICHAASKKLDKQPLRNINFKQTVTTEKL